MIRIPSLTLAILAVGAIPTLAHDAGLFAKAPPDAPYQEVSKLVKLSLPGLGQLYVDPATLPAGPFLAYDHEGQLVSTVFMIPVTDLNPDKSFDNLSSPGGDVDHVDIYFNAGHPGVEVPHAHVVLWHVPAADEARVAQ